MKTALPDEMEGLHCQFFETKREENGDARRERAQTSLLVVPQADVVPHIERELICV